MDSKISSFYIFLILTITILKIACINENNSINKNIQTNYTSYFINSTIKTLNNNNFDSIINPNNSINYLILFTVRRCPICNKIIRITENVETYYKNNTNLKFAKVDCYISGWTAMRFNIFKFPLYIYISKGKYSTFIPDNITEEELINFIESKNKIYKDYPPKIGYFGVFMKIFHLLTEKIQKIIPFWNEIFSWIVLLILFGSFLYFEYSVYKACWDSYKNSNPTKKEEKKENKMEKTKKE